MMKIEIFSLQNTRNNIVSGCPKNLISFFGFEGISA